MAQHITVLLVDDLDGTEAADVTTVHFALDGVAYAIDLTDANATALRDSLADFVEAGRRVGGRIKRSGRPAASTPGSTEAQRIREWAANNGVEIAPRGRIPNHIVERYQKTQEPAVKPKTTREAAAARKPARKRTRVAN